MTEQINKQCPFCGEYIPINDTQCKYCNENLIEDTQVENSLELNDNSSNSDINENKEPTLSEEPTSEEENLPKKSNNKKMYILITLITFVIGFCVVFGILYYMNKHTDVTIAPKSKPSVPKLGLLNNKNSDNINRAKQLYKDGKTDEAAQIFQDEITASNNPNAYYYLGEIYKDADFTKIAISNYKKALSYKKDFYEPLKRLAEIYVKKSENDVALDYANKALKQKPNDVELLQTLAQIYINTDEEDKLLQTYQKIVSIDKKNHDANYYIAKHFYYKEKYKEAIPYFQNLLNAEFDSDMAYGLALCYAHIEYYSKAIETLNLIIKKDPSEYYEATAAKARLSNMKDYYNATHGKKSSPDERNNRYNDDYRDEAEDALF